jgi:hemolysin activation/secretion protein
VLSIIIRNDDYVESLLGMTIISARMRRSLYLATMCGGLMCPHIAFAQDMILPGSADPGRTFENQKQVVPPREDLEVEAPPKQAFATAPEGADNLKFVLRSLVVDNMTAYEPQDVAPFYQDQLGREISVATLFDIMTKVQQKYLDDGYALTKVVIPNQNIQNGDVHLAVIEGHVSEVEISGDIRSSSVIDDAANRIRSMRPLNVKKLERIMLIVNDLPDLNASAVLANSVHVAEPGAVRLIIQKNPEKEKIASIGIDDHGSVYTGPLQSKASARMFHLGPNYSELELSGVASIPFQEQRLAAASYSMPVFGASGANLSFNASRSGTEPGSDLSVLDIKGASHIAGAEISYPFIRQRDMTLSANAGFEWKDMRTKILGEELYDDRLRVAKIGASFNFTDNWAGYSLMDINYSKGLDILGVRESGSVDLSREDGKSDFSKIEILAGRVQALPGNFEVFALFNGQYAYDTLLSSEEFGFGGGQVGRGFDPSEITGDHGVSASIEVRRTTQMTVFSTSLAVQPYAFYDIGKIWNIDEGAKDNISAASAGIGVRMDIGNDWNLDFNLAKPLTKSAENEPKYQNDLGGRALFSISKSF